MLWSESKGCLWTLSREEKILSIVKADDIEPEHLIGIIHKDEIHSYISLRISGEIVSSICPYSIDSPIVEF